MNEEALDKKFEEMTKTLMNSMGELHHETMGQIQNTKLELFDRISAESAKLRDELAPRETVEDHERRLLKLEAHLS